MTRKLRMQLAGMAALLLSACSTTGGTVETIKFPLDRDDWELTAQRKVPGVYWFLEFKRKDRTSTDPAERAVIHNFGGTPKLPLREDYEAVVKAGDSACPDLTDWRVIEETDAAITYEAITGQPCAGGPPQHEIGKILHGKYNKFVVVYAKRVARLPEKERERWLKLFKEATIITSDPNEEKAVKLLGRTGTLMPFILLPHSQ